jgi:DNA (cytosine-5)-methyltransferase 1
MSCAFEGAVCMNNTIKFIDLFAGIGGIRKGFELACEKQGYKTECVLTSEIKPHAIEILKQNHPKEKISGDVTAIPSSSIPNFDFLLAGFPCQAFSSAGKRLGFLDTRGTLFFEVERILKDKKPNGFILENVEGLVNHDKANPKDKIGRTLKTILERLEKLGYKVSWEVLNAINFGVPQDRKRIYIVGTKIGYPNLEKPPLAIYNLGSKLEKGLETSSSSFVKLLLDRYSTDELYGKSIKDKRGGSDNIHSWDIELKGKVSNEQKQLLNQMLKERRKKKWAEEYGIDWMDGMPLTIEQIRTFFDRANLKEMLNDLVQKKYLKLEHPKMKVGSGRKQDTSLPLGYNIVTGKMSFEINKILDPDGHAPTLVAMDMKGLHVADNGGLRNLSLREGLRLFGYPDNYKFDIDKELGYDLLGNTVVVPVIAFVVERLLNVFKEVSQNEIEIIRRAV